MSRWLITRPQADATRLAATLDAMGHSSVLSPVIRVVPRQFRPINWSRYDAIIFTSANAVRLGGDYPQAALSLPVFTVGDKTAAAARGAGFTTVSSANGNVDTLAQNLALEVHNAPTRYLHICGWETKGSLQGALSATGGRVETVAVYEVEPAAELTGEAVGELKAGTLDGAIFLSPNTARIFARLAANAKIGARADGFVFAVISQATAAELSGLGGTIAVAEHPDLEHVLALLH